MEPFLGQLMLVGFNFAPRGWAFCDGQLMSIAQNSALFSLLGTTYGGDGVTTFALPDLRGRAPIHLGQGPGLSNYMQGEAGGRETVTLNAATIPAHTHVIVASTSEGNSKSPEGNLLAASGAGQVGTGTYTSSAANAALAANAVGPAGGSQPHDNMPPFLVCNYIIATEGVFPSRG